MLLVIGGAYVASRYKPPNSSPFQVPDPPGTTLPGGSENGVLYTAVERIRPARQPDLHALPLPRLSDRWQDRFDPMKHPPRAWVERHLCQADPALLTTFREQAVASEVDELYGYMLDECGDGSRLCALAREWLKSGNRTQIETALYSRVLSHCDVSRLDTLKDDPNISPVALVRYDRQFRPERRLFHAGRALDAGSFVDFMEAVFAPGGLTDIERAQLLAMADAGSERQRRLVVDFIERPAFDAGDPADLADRLGNGDVSIAVLYAADGGVRPEMKDHVVTCARSPGKRARHCLRILAESDWNTARLVANSIHRDDPIADLLRRFESPEALDAELQQFGIDAGTLSGSVTSALWSAGAMRGASGLRTSSGDDLVDLASPEFDDVVVRWQRPRKESESGRLEAWMGDAKYIREIAPGCDVEDPAAVLGFANVLMRERPAERRFFTVRTLGSEAGEVVLLTPAQFHAMTDAGILFPVAPELMLRPPLHASPDDADE